MPRLHGEGKHRIEYRHIIDWLVRKPGAFENYRYRDDLFPTHRFRMAYDALKRGNINRADKEYLRILYLAARENESAVDDALRYLFDSEEPVTVRTVEEIIESGRKPNSPRDVTIDDVDIKAYDVLLSAVETG